MKMTDVLRGIADLLDQQPDSESDHVAKQQGLEPVEIKEPKLDNSPVMVPPLQAKLELLKKSSGVPSFYGNDSDDELDDIKKLTGINAVMQQEAGEDNDIVG